MAFEISQELSGEWERALDKHQMVSRWNFAIAFKTKIRKIL